MKKIHRIPAIVIAVLVVVMLYNWYRFSDLRRELALFRHDMQNTATCHAAAQRVNAFLEATKPFLTTDQTRASIVWGD